MDDIKPITKAEPFTLVNAAVRQNCVNRMKQLPLDGSVTVIIRKTGAKSARQRGLQHIWYDDIVKSGLGGYHEENKERLDLTCKYRWGIRIMTAQGQRPYLAESYLDWFEKHGQDPERMMWWVEQNIHTEQMTQNEMAQFLTAIRDHYGFDIGVELTDPDAKGWADLLEENSNAPS